MQDIQERSIGITSNLPYLGLVHKGIVEEICGILFLGLLTIHTHLIAVLILRFLRRRPRYVEPHLSKLVSRSSCFAALGSCTTKVTVCARLVAVRRQRELH